jgi:hypothetical protein
MRGVAVVEDGPEDAVRDVFVEAFDIAAAEIDGHDA